MRSAGLASEAFMPSELEDLMGTGERGVRVSFPWIADRGSRIAGRRTHAAIDTVTGHFALDTVREMRRGRVF
jgi:hypothetical protein